MKIEYGSSAVYASLESRMKEDGLDVDEYIEFFGFPEDIEAMQVDSKWFSPALPGMEEHTTVVHTMVEAEDMLRVKKEEALLKQLSDKRCDGYAVKLDDDEYDKWSSSEDANHYYDDEWQYLHDWVCDQLDEIIAISDEWEITGRNLNWRGSSGDASMKLQNARDVLDIFSSYGDYSLTITQEEEEKEKGTFTIKCYHHDCPMGSVFDFEPIKEKDEA